MEVARVRVQRKRRASSGTTRTHRADPSFQARTDAEPDLGRITVRLPATCHLRVFLDDAASSDSLRLEDERGASLSITA